MSKKYSDLHDKKLNYRICPFSYNDRYTFEFPDLVCDKGRALPYHRFVGLRQDTLLIW